MNARDEESWRDAAADAYTNLTRTTPIYPKTKMLAVVDDICQRRTASQDELQERHGKQDFISTTIGNVTTAVHGLGPVPKEGGWYRKVGGVYHVHPAFAAAWNRRRRPQEGT